MYNFCLLKLKKVVFTSLILKKSQELVYVDAQITFF